MSTLLLSDLHLPPQPSALRDSFIAFLDGPARSASVVYILGDLFEYWIGDDVGLDVYAAEIAGLASLTASGVPVRVQRGNRDFLLGPTFERASGARLLADPSVVDIDGERWLLTHGDAFCTDDVGYQKWRRFSRNRAVQAIFARLPRRWRERIAGGVRGSSREAKTGKSAQIMDVNDAAVARGLHKAQTLHLIHGHTHRPAEHKVASGGIAGERIVLADWRDDRREYLEINGGVRRRINLV
ncbi:MAG: UDP-2,3-diacylglucosamine diphosphatase [Hydrocarboniphaga sp.]|uniref:UDP-2,3-diacylglucosamine diphosphatase n=1 Tax=Hydrocarboniphaga sp. TaxID=2033016 RepID=UPI002633B187|nr:UDP-2,3-diacylglucosamine diphosphatase [Hydrocarboniphaga sp.]MDB5973168.1 UDP-2,3-diacylglucosamine diphosphatase [Hydrocarboniphaga sp.]